MVGIKHGEILRHEHRVLLQPLHFCHHDLVGPCATVFDNSRLGGGFDQTIMPTEVHEGEEAQQTVVVGIEIAVLERLMAGVPQGIDKFLALVMVAEDGGGSRGGHQSDAMTEFLGIVACWQDLALLWQSTINAVLIHEVVKALGIEEVLDALAILLLPLAIGSAPDIVERDIHGHAPGVVAEILRTKATAPGHLHHLSVVTAHVGIETCHGMSDLVEIGPRLGCTVKPEISPSIVSILRPHLIEGRNVVRGIRKPVAEAVRGKGDQMGLRIDQKHLLQTCLLSETAKTSKA